jgi:CheY-like chemotaxis protein
MEKMEANNYDLVLCDWKMPHVSGIELLEWIRNHPDLKSTPFILITANNERDSIIKANELGVDDYILKPLTVENLIEKLSSIINLKLSKAHE